MYLVKYDCVFGLVFALGERERERERERESCLL